MVRRVSCLFCWGYDPFFSVSATLTPSNVSFSRFQDSWDSWQFIPASIWKEIPTDNPSHRTVSDPMAWQYFYLPCPTLEFILSATNLGYSDKKLSISSHDLKPFSPHWLTRFLENNLINLCSLVSMCDLPTCRPVFQDPNVYLMINSWAVCPLIWEMDEWAGDFLTLSIFPGL